MYSKSGNTEFMTYDNAGDVVDEHFESLLLRCQSDLETSVTRTDYPVSIEFPIQSTCYITNVTK